MSVEQEQKYRYAILMETNGEEYESWYNFIRYEGNEEALEHLEKQLSKVDFYILEDLSTFDLDLKHLVSEETAKQMCSVDLNAYMFHRKFDGKLQKIDFQFSKKDDNEDKLEKVYEVLGKGDIDQFVDGEDPCDDGYSKHGDSESENEILSDSEDDSSPSPSPVKKHKDKKDKKEKEEKKESKDNKEEKKKKNKL
jgi:hypothetical protein